MSGKSRWALLVLTHMLIVSLMLLGAGCSESTSPEENGGDTDTTPPELSSVTPTDNSHIEVSFNEEVDEVTAQHRNNYAIHRYDMSAHLESNPPKSSLDYGDTLYVNSAVMLADGMSVRLSLSPPMLIGGMYHLIADKIKDLSGNAMIEPDTLDFVGVSTPDETPPEIIDRSPYPGEPGIGIGQSVTVTFSEPMNWISVQDAFSWKAPGDVDVSFDMRDIEPHIFSFTPEYPLDYNTIYTVEFEVSTAEDYSGNYLDAASWSFTTTNIPDTTHPTVVSTAPADEETNVSVDVILQIEFSEPIDPSSMEEGGIIITPETGDGIVTWTDGGSTLNFEPDNPLLDDTAYYLVIIEGAVRDFAGNFLSGNYSVTFTTGAALPTGGYSGTIAGDPHSTAAANPEGALSIAFMVNMFTGGGDEGPPPIGGFDVVDSDGSYEIGLLEDGTYWPGCMMDTDGNGEINPDLGDAIGIYGVDFTTLEGEPEPDSVIIAGGGTLADIDFGIYDPIAIWGDVTYGGTLYSSNLDEYNYYVGLFDTLTYDPENLDPDYGTEGQSIVYDHEFVVHEFNDGLVEGSYYIGAYMDANHNSDYDPGIDPVGFYEIGGEMAYITVENGEDSGDGIVIVLQDPDVGAALNMGTVSWIKANNTESRMNPQLRAVIENIKRALEERQR